MEIEQKFLVNGLPDGLDEYECIDIVQGYLSYSPVLRVRKSNNRYIFTYKSDRRKQEERDACISEEIEALLTKEAFELLLAKCDGIIITKKRYIIPLDAEETGVSGIRAELDVFNGVYEGLVLAEVEFASYEDMKKFNRPSWFGKNVSGDIRYHNNYLAMGRKE